ncbi:hypothetical protein ABT282_08140 [Streptomyces sp. NPDC000927]|uniref:hypothetical protein n=1 Tax=Streptomyces sp. NPDC000927 TaxID=3154371 RepID=UPI00331A79CD
MNSATIKRHIAMCLGSFGAVALTVGFLTGSDAWMVIGFMHLITASLWAYGQTPTKK